MKKQYTLQQLSDLTQAELVGNPNLIVSNVDSLESAQANDASFLSNPLYKKQMYQSNAGVICIDKNTPLIKGKNFLICDNPSQAFQCIAKELLGLTVIQENSPKVHPTDIIHESAKIGKNVTIGPNVIIEKNAVVADHSHIHALVFIGTEVKIGSHCILHPNSVVRERCVLGNHVILQPGAIIGSCGYGYITDSQTGTHTKLEQFGYVNIEDNVEIGANTTIDRARFKVTTVKKGTKIDNLVQIGHNVEVGENNLIVSQSGIAGSAKLGRNVFMGGQAGVVGHLKICDNVKIATRGGVSKSIKLPGIYGGGPVEPIARFNKQQVLLRQIEKHVKEIKDLKAKITKLESILKTEESEK